MAKRGREYDPAVADLGAQLFVGPDTCAVQEVPREAHTLAVAPGLQLYEHDDASLAMFKHSINHRKGKVKSARRVDFTFRACSRAGKRVIIMMIQQFAAARGRGGCDYGK